jgi:hypothetical protein
MNNSFKLLVLSIFLLFGTVSFSQIKTLDVGDVDSFGTSFIGKPVQLKGMIFRTYASSLPSNKGYQSIQIKNADQSKYELGLIKLNAYSFETYKEWMNNDNELLFIGKVAMREVTGGINNKVYKSPVLLIEKIELVK